MLEAKEDQLKMLEKEKDTSAKVCFVFVLPSANNNINN